MRQLSLDIPPLSDNFLKESTNFLKVRDARIAASEAPSEPAHNLDRDQSSIGEMLENMSGGYGDALHSPKNTSTGFVSTGPTR